MTPIDIIGWIGSIFLAFCGLPQAIKTFKTQKTIDLSWWFLILWGTGELFCFVYIILTNWNIQFFQWPLYLNYLFNIVIVFYLFFAKVKHDG